VLQFQVIGELIAIVKRGNTCVEMVFYVLENMIEMQLELSPPFRLLAANLLEVFIVYPVVGHWVLTSCLATPGAFGKAI